MSPTDELAECSRHLRAASPKEWDRFLQTFDAYATEVTVAVISAGQNDILVAQGKAKAFLHLNQTFRNCHVVPTPKPPSA